MAYVSITGLRVRSFWRYPRFAFHGARSMMQARSADGNLFADARKIHGVHHTLTVWTDRSAMLAYLRAGAHRRAMVAFPSLGTGYAFGFEAMDRPEWSAVHALWLAEGERRHENKRAGEASSRTRPAIGPDRETVAPVTP